jgi:hypothetical protein
MTDIEKAAVVNVRETGSHEEELAQRYAETNSVEKGMSSHRSKYPAHIL